MTSPVVVYPLFSECQDYTLDQYWRDVFFQCACNKFPRGVRYDSSSHSLFIRVIDHGERVKTETVILPSRTPEEVFISMMEVFRNQLKLHSSSDLRSRKKELSEKRAESEIDMDCEWKKLKPRSVRDNLLMKYICQLEKEHNLTEKESRFLWVTIQIGFQSKKLTSDDVVYEDCQIQRIDGLEYDEKKGDFVLTRECRLSNKSDKPQPRNKFNQSIDRFIRDCKSRRIRMQA